MKELQPISPSHSKPNTASPSYPRQLVARPSLASSNINHYFLYKFLNSPSQGLNAHSRTKYAFLCHNMPALNTNQKLIYTQASTRKSESKHATQFPNLGLHSRLH